MRPPVSLLLLGAALSAAAGPQDTLRTGRSLYQSSAGLDLVDVHRHDGGPLPPARFTCMGCHGAEGEGRLEGGLQSPPIGPAALGLNAPARITGAMHGGVLMPTYGLSPRDGEALAAYLAVVGTEAGRDPGVSVDAIRLAILMPEDAGAEGTAAVDAVDALNARGGIFGRRLVAELLPSSAQDIAGQDKVFALVTASPVEAGALAAIARSRMPVLSPYPAAAPAESFVYRLPPGTAAADALNVLAEALRRSGRAVSRERVRAELDGMRGPRSGLLQPASPGLRRRTGTGAAAASFAGPGMGEAASQEPRRRGP